MPRIDLETDYPYPDFEYDIVDIISNPKTYVGYNEYDGFFTFDTLSPASVRAWRSETSRIATRFLNNRVDAVILYSVVKVNDIDKPKLTEIAAYHGSDKITVAVQQRLIKERLAGKKQLNTYDFIKNFKQKIKG